MSEINAEELLELTHPGEVLLEEFLKPMNISQSRLAKDLGVARVAISKIVRGERDITAEKALMLSKYFGTTAQLWMNLQAGYDLRKAARSPETVQRLERIQPRELLEAA